MISLITVLLWWLFWLSTLWKTKRGRWIQAIGIGCIVFFGSASLYQYRVNWYPRAHMRETTIVRVGPDSSYGIGGTVTQNEEVMIYSTHQGWKKIKKGKLIGWVPENTLFESHREI